ncbi:MAG TPA: hypothetical protein VFG39_05575, partial [Balneolaceae bacterium]|nr:hypothetical protein [Balneolaceae bacterium]
VNPFLFLSYVAYVLPVLLIYSGFYLLLGIFYLIHLLQNKRLDNEKKILWIAVFVAFNALSLPAYWLVHIWKDEPNQAEKKTSINYGSPGTEF